MPGTPPEPVPRPRARRAALVGALLALGAPLSLPAVPDPTAEQRAQALRLRFESQRAAMADSDFGRPLRLESSDRDRRARGEVLALLEQALTDLDRALQDPWRWCEIMLLTPSISRCEVQDDNPPRLEVRLARRFDQMPQEGIAAQFAFHRQASDAHYSAVRLEADEGPIGTSDYRIEVEALALDPERSVVRMAYSYRYGLMASLASKAYLAGKGGGKVGFTRIGGAQDDARIGGMRGSVERNAMRYYLAIEAHVAQAVVGPEAPSSRLAGSLERWLEAIARHPHQLAETDPKAYRRVKHERFATFAAGRGS